MFPYHKVIVLIPSNINLFYLSSHHAPATETSIQDSLSKITEWYPLSRALSYHLAIRKSCVRGGNVVAEGGQKRCGTRPLESVNKKNEKTGAPSPALHERIEENEDSENTSNCKRRRKGWWWESQIRENSARCCKSLSAESNASTMSTQQ